MGTSFRSFVVALNKNGLRCFFSSRCRTAEEFASRLAKEGTRYGLKGIVADPEECDMEELTQVTNA